VPRSTDPPIATATVARLYMEQGKLDQAALIYRNLLDLDPQDIRLASGLAEVQRRRDGLAEISGTGDGVRLERVADGGVVCQWRVTDEGQARGSLALGRTGRLVLRVVAFPMGPQTTVQDIELSSPTGEMRIDPPAGAELVGAAVGLLGGERAFASITHCAPLELGPA